jgi:hypothetical protein
MSWKETLMKEQNRFIIPFAILGLSLIFCAILIGGTLRAVKRAEQTIEVTGSAKKRITSDLAELSFTVNASAVTSLDAFHSLENKKPIAYEYLAQQGFPKEKVTLSTVEINTIFERNNQGESTGKVIGYEYSQKFTIQSNDVTKIKNLALDLPMLVEKGIDITVHSPAYYYTKLAELKVDIQADAAKDAMNRAQRIAQVTGNDVSSMRSARMGVLQITSANSTEISDYGQNDVSSIEKEITAVVSADFEIK